MATKAAAANAEKDTASTAQNRFVVSLPKDVGEMIDRVGARLTNTLAKQTGVAFELSRAQIVQALVRQALASADDDATENAESNDGDGGDAS